MKLREIGGDEGDRTPDLLHAKQALSQLSYTPIYSGKRSIFIIHPKGVFVNYLFAVCFFITTSVTIKIAIDTGVAIIAIPVPNV